MWSFECKPKPGFHGHIETALDILYPRLSSKASIPLLLAPRMPPTPPPMIVLTDANGSASALFCIPVPI